mgnify:FL=1|jgi:hypothetical protein
MKSKSLFFVLVVATIFYRPTFLPAQELRSINVIPTPVHLKTPGKTVEQPVAPRADVVRGKVDKALRSWNNGDISSYLSDNFYDKSRFGDSMQTSIPKDAKLRVLDMGSMQILEQKIVTDPDGSRRRVTLGSVEVNSQIEFNDNKNGFVRVPGKNEILYEMSEKIKEAKP